MTEDGDIGFRLYYVKTQSGEKFDVVKNERVESHLMMEEGEIICSQPVLCMFPKTLIQFNCNKLKKLKC
jgi:hypothetical protein